MSDNKLEKHATDVTRRKFLKRSGVALLPYAAPLIASITIYPEDAEAQRRGRRMRRSRRMMGGTGMM